MHDAGFPRAAIAAKLQVTEADVATWLAPPAELEKAEVSRAILRELASLSASAETKDAAALSSRSLEAVVKLTEYEDGKAQRILTAVAFVSTFAALMHVQLFLQRPALARAAAENGCEWLPAGLHILFGLYAGFVAVGVTLVLIAIAPSFYVPGSWHSGGEVKSRLFYEIIAGTHPETWAKSFNVKLQELALAYHKDTIHEAYLVATKVGRKMWWMTPGVYAFIIASCLLVGWLVLFAILVWKTYPLR